MAWLFSLFQLVKEMENLVLFSFVFFGVVVAVFVAVFDGEGATAATFFFAWKDPLFYPLF